MTRFGPDPLAFFEAVYREPAPWDIGGPQPAMKALLAEYPPEGPVLDVGCGSGDLAIHIAKSGIGAVGIDFVEEAINQAQAKRAALAPEVITRLDFRVGDALRPSVLGRTFGAVVDSGFYHLLDPDQCRQLVDEVARVLRPRGRYYLHEFAVAFPGPNMPREVTEAELRERFTAEAGWKVMAVRPAEFMSKVGAVPAIVACILRDEG